MGRLIDALRRLRSLSTPFGGVSFDPPPANVAKDAFSVAFDLNILGSLAFARAAGGGPELDGLYNTQRVLVEERVARAGIKLDLPLSVAELNLRAASTLFRELDAEASARFQAVRNSYVPPYSLGRWLADVTQAVAFAQTLAPAQIDELLSAHIARFDDVAKGTIQLNASRECTRELSALRDELGKLARQDKVTEDQYATFSERVRSLTQSLAGA